MLSIIIPLWNVKPELAEMTEGCLAQIEKVSQVKHEIILVDNGSPYKKEYKANVCRIWEENRGIAAAWNEGAASAAFKGEVFVFLNNDVIVQPGWDAALDEAAKREPRIVFPYTDHLDGRGFRASDGNVAGWCFALSARTFNGIGWFDETFSPAFYEDTDYFHRAWALNIPMDMIPEARVTHERRTTAQHLSNVSLLFQANRLRYAWKHNVNPAESPPFYNR